MHATAWRLDFRQCGRKACARGGLVWACVRVVIGLFHYLTVHPGGGGGGNYTPLQMTINGVQGGIGNMFRGGGGGGVVI